MFSSTQNFCSIWTVCTATYTTLFCTCELTQIRSSDEMHVCPVLIYKFDLHLAVFFAKSILSGALALKLGRWLHAEK